KKRQASTEASRPLRCPPRLIYLWNWFVEVMSGASGGGSGPTTIAWVDLRAWADQTGEVVEPWESRLMIRLSVLRAEIESEEIRKVANGPKGQNRPHRSMGESRS